MRPSANGSRDSEQAADSDGGGGGRPRRSHPGCAECSRIRLAHQLAAWRLAYRRRLDALARRNAHRYSGLAYPRTYVQPFIDTWRALAYAFAIAFAARTVEHADLIARAAHAHGHTQLDV